MKWIPLIISSLFSLLLVGCVENEKNTQEIQQQQATQEVTAKSTETIESNENTVNDEVEYEINEKTEQSEVTLQSCYDADTCTFITNTGSSVKVRFLLIDAPEVQDRTTGKEQKGAEEAKNRTREILSNAKTITLETDVGDKYDKYNRQLAYVFADNQSVQEILLKEGLVKVSYVFPPNTRYLKEFEAAEAIAKQAKVGLWNE